MKIHFRVQFFLLVFFGQKTGKIDEKLRKLPKSKPFDNFLLNLICRCLQTKENDAKTVF